MIRPRQSRWQHHPGAPTYLHSSISLLIIIIVLVLSIAPAASLPVTTPLAPQPAAAQASNIPFIPMELLGIDTRHAQRNFGIALADIEGDGDLDLFVGDRLFLNDQGTFATTPAWDYNIPETITSVAVADYDLDNDLDIAIATLNDKNYLFENESTHEPIFTDITEDAWPQAAASNTYGLAWGDIDGNGTPDLVVGNGGASNEVYLHHGSKLTLSTTLPGPGGEAGDTRGVALADMDRDGDLDLAVTNEGEENWIYTNDGGNLITLPVQAFGAADSPTVSVAWGDYNNDGYPDLATAEKGKQNHLYPNNRDGTLGTAIALPETETTSDVAWLDYDSDGDLDLLAANLQGPLHLYRNDNGFAAPLAKPVWVSSERDNIHRIATGDGDGDGDLDVAVSIEIKEETEEGTPITYATARIYHNELAPLTPKALLHADKEATFVTSTDWGDYDGDGDLDLAVGRSGFFNSVYLNHNGTLQHIWTSSEQDNTTCVAWGDYDGDGDLDLAVGNDGQVNRVYENTGTTLQLAWSSDEAEQTTSIAWADMDGDNDLDLAVGNDGQVNRVYENTGTTLQLAWSSDEAEQTTSIAWGDIDGDNDLDLAVGNDGQEQVNRVYLNDRGTLDAQPAWSSAEAHATQSIAWGDINGDGRVDLITGNANEPNHLYLNTGGTLATQPGWSSIEADHTMAIALGDIDGDGDHELVTRNRGQPSRIYRNDAGTLRSAAIWSSPESHESSRHNNLALVDLDRDGDLDLITGDATLNDTSDSFHWYRNAREARNSHNPIPFISATRPASLADADGYTTPTILDERSIKFPYTVFDPQCDRIRRIEAEYSKDGGGTWHPAAASDDTITTNLETCSRSDNTTSRTIPDGGTLVSELNFNETGTVDTLEVSMDIKHASNRQIAATLSAHWPEGETTTVTLFENLTSDGPEDVRITLSDLAPAAIDPAQRLQNGIYRPIAGQSLGVFRGMPRDIPLTLSITDGTAGTQGTLEEWSITTGRTHTFTWDTFKSGFFGQSDDVMLRFTAIPSIPIPSRANALAGPYQRGAYATRTLAFRARGTQVQVLDATGKAANNALVFRRPKDSTAPASAMMAQPSEPFRTNANGYLQGSGEILPGDELIALVPFKATQAYTIYHTNLNPNAEAGSAQAYLVNDDDSQITLKVSEDYPLMLLSLDISLEWDARKDSGFLERLQSDLERASASLYDWSNGQIALGTMRVYQDLDYWEDAHVRIYASNRLRPNADQGGIVDKDAGWYDEKHCDDKDDTFLCTDPDVPTVQYRPGQLRIGATWNRYGDPQGDVGDDWPRTLAHELAHYALFLDDNYLGLDENGLLTPVSCAGAMFSPYTDEHTEFFPVTGWEKQCAKTLSHQTTKRPDWATITTFYPGLKLPGTSFAELPEGPFVLPLEATRVIFPPPATSPDKLLDATIFTLIDATTKAPVRLGSTARALLFDNTGDYVTDLGGPLLDQVHARGAAVDDRLCVYAPEAGKDNAPLIGCKTIAQGDSLQLVMHERHGWQPDIRITPVTSSTIEVSVTGIDADLLMGKTLKAELYPENNPVSDEHEDNAALAKGEQLCIKRDQKPTKTYEATLEQREGVYRAHFDLCEPALAGKLHIWVPQGDEVPDFSIVSTYALGGNPGHHFVRRSRSSSGSTRRRLGQRREQRRRSNGIRRSRGRYRSRRAPAVSPDGTVILFGKNLNFEKGQFYTLQVATALPNIPAWTTRVGQAYHLLASENAPSLDGVSVSFAYLGSDVSLDDEANLIIYFSADGTTWEPLETFINDEENMATARSRGEGLYALLSTTELELRKGWNTPGFPLSQTQPITSTMQSLQGKYTSVWQCEQETNGQLPGEACRGYHAVAPEWRWLNTLHTMAFGEGYVIHMLEDAIWYINGMADGASSDDTQPTASARSGTTEEYQSNAAVPALYYGAVLPGDTFTPAPGLPVDAFIKGTWCGSGETRSQDGKVVYAITVVAAGCGALPGDVVTFEVNGQVMAPMPAWSNWQANRLDLTPAPVLNLPATVTITEGASMVTLPLTLSTTTPHTVTLDVRTVEVSALADEDYQPLTGTLTISPGLQTAAITVPITDDRVWEDDEVLRLEMGTVRNATLGSTDLVTITIVDDDSPPPPPDEEVPPQVSFAFPYQKYPEGAGVVPITATLDITATQPITCSVEISNGSAELITDTLVLPTGVLTRTIEVSITDDTLPQEPDETQVISLTCHVSAEPGNRAQTILIIQDDDTVPPDPSEPKASFERGTYEAREDSGTASLPIKLDSSSSQTITLECMSIPVSATLQSDYIASSEVITFTPGVTESACDILLLDDEQVEDPEEVRVVLHNPKGAQLGEVHIATLTITDDDNDPDTGGVVFLPLVLTGSGESSQ